MEVGFILPPLEEADEEMDVGKGSPTADLVPKEVLAPWATMLPAPRFWAAGPSDQVPRRGLVASLRARVKAPTIQAKLWLPADIDKELVC